MKTRDAVIYHPIGGNFFAWMVCFFFITLTYYWNGSFAWFEGYWPFIAGTGVAAFWTTRLHAYREALRIVNKKQVIKHWQRVLQRGFVAMAIGMTIHIMAEGFVLTAYIRGIFCAAYLLSVFWLTFDFVLNVERDLEVFYVSSWYKSSGLDRWFSQFDSPVLWLVSKVAALLLFMILYYKSFVWEF